MANVLATTRPRVLGMAVVLAAACSRDHSALEADPAVGGGGASATASVGLIVSSGAGGGGFGGSGAGAGGDGTAAGPSTSAGTGGELPQEPEGPSRLVLVHGILDRTRIAVCFATTLGTALAVSPTPPGGLAFASAVAIDPEVLPARGDVVVVLLAGSAADLDATSCDDVLAAPADHPDLEIAALGTLPRSAASAPRVLALVAAGCLGGEDEVSEVGEQACGPGFGPFSPTAMLLAVSPSRLIAEGRVGLQAIGGAVAATPFDVVVRAGGDEVVVPVADELSLGAALPFPPNTTTDALALAGGGATLEAVALLPGSETVLATVDLEAAKDRAGIATLEDGHTYALVFVGPQPTLGEGPFWPAFDAALLEIAPDE